MPNWEQELESILTGLGVQQEEDRSAESWDSDFDIQGAIRSTLRSIQWLLRESSLPEQMREDIDVTLYFLRRHAQMETESGQEQLTRTSALLRFCRIVLAVVGEE